MLSKLKIWRQHPEYPSYEFSIYGGVRCNDGKPVSCYYSARYWHVYIRRVGQRRLHVLILETFRGARPAGMLGCHNDDNRDNNALSNLAWKTYSQNGKDMVLNGYKHSTTTRAKMSASAVGNTNGRALKGKPANNKLGSNQYIRKVG